MARGHGRHQEDSLALKGTPWASWVWPGSCRGLGVSHGPDKGKADGHSLPISPPGPQRHMGGGFTALGLPSGLHGGMAKAMPSITVKMRSPAPRNTCRAVLCLKWGGGGAFVRP